MHKGGWLALALAAASLAACGTGLVLSDPVKPSERPGLATALEQVLPALEADHVELWQSQPCRALETAQGEFRDPEPALGCGPYVFDGEPKRFDDEANAVYARVSDALQQSGAKPPEYGWFYYGGGGLTRAIFWYGLADTEVCMEATLTWDAVAQTPEGDDGPGETTSPIADHWTWHEGKCD
jgi:hypothetical protein